MKIFLIVASLLAAPPASPPAAPGKAPPAPGGFVVRPAPVVRPVADAPAPGAGSLAKLKARHPDLAKAFPLDMPVRPVARPHARSRPPFRTRRPAPVRAAKPGDPQAGPGVVNLSKVLDAGRDNSAALQAAVDAAPPWTAFRVPAGGYGGSHPVVVDKAGITFHGVPGGVSTLNLGGGGQGLIFGLRRNQNGSVLGDSYFPPTALDQTAQGRVGFCSGGDTGIQVSNHRLCWGGRSKLDPGVCDRWGDLPGYTISTAFDAMGSTGFVVCSVGGSWAEVSPLWLGVVAAPGRSDVVDLALLYKLAGDDLAPGAPFRRADLLVVATGLVEPEFVFDFAGSKKLAARLGGKPATLTGQTDLAANAPKFAPGFPQTRGQFPFDIGFEGYSAPGGPLPKWTLHGLKLSAVALPASGATSHARYFDNSTPGCVALFEGRRDPTGRLVPFLDGTGFGGYRGYGWAFTGPRNTPSFVGGNGVFDLQISGSPAVLLGEVNDFQVERCGLFGGSCGIGTAPYQCSYPGRMEQVHTGGWDSGLNLGYLAGWSLRNVHVDQGGATYARFTGAGVTWDTGTLAFGSAAMLSAVECLPYPYSGGGSFRNLMVDNEYPPLPHSIFYLTAPPYLAADYTVEGCTAAALGPAGSWLYLAGWDQRGIGKPATVNARGNSGGGGAAAVTVKGGDWSGTVVPALLEAKAVVGAAPGTLSTK